MSERRRHTRYETYLPVQIDTPDKPARIGVSHNVSSAGMLIATPSRFRVGQPVEVTFRVSERGAKRTRTGRIMRLYDEWGLSFPRRLAVVFDREDPGIEPLIQLASA
ncbi:MAG: PilZ domain-containing protein [Polyangiaceae bacterium]